MKRTLLIYLTIAIASASSFAQTEPQAGNWKTWFITSGKAYRLPAPSSNKEEIAQVIAAQQNVDAAALQKIAYWNAGAPGYRWYSFIGRLWMTDISGKGALANMLMGTAIYDATIAAWDTKYAYNRPRPFAVSNKITALVAKPESPSYPCEFSVAAGAAVTIISHYFPNMADSVKRMSERMMAARLASGVAFPSDMKAGFELGKKIAEEEIALTKDYIFDKPWDGKYPDKKGIWNGKTPMFPNAGLYKTVVLENASALRPGPPPDFAKEMEELKNFKQTFSSQANAFKYASQPTSDDLLHKKVMEYNVSANPPRAARIYAATNIAYYDAFLACFDAKYAYWGIRPDQYDPTYKPLMMTPPFPGYPSGHATMSGVVAELFPYFFPLEKQLCEKVAKDGAESRFHAGIHFRTDNEAGLDLGRKVAGKIIERLKADGADGDFKLASRQ